MKRMLIGACVFLAACGGGHDDHAKHADHDAHEAGCDHADHGSTAAEGHAHGGNSHAMGSVTIAESTFALRQHGEVIAGGEAVYTIALTTGTAPATLRAWIGTESGRGSMKTRLSKTGTGAHYDAHLAVPSPLPTDSRLWLEVTTADGERTTTSLALPAADDTNTTEDHDAHKHDTGKHEDDGEPQTKAGNRIDAKSKSDGKC